MDPASPDSSHTAATPDPNILPSNQAAVATGAPVAPPKPIEAAASGPIRHPRPMTAAELHSQFEREQEAVVNRLNRELSIARNSHNASTVSNASSTTSLVQDIPPAAADSHLLPLSSSSYGAPRRHQRTSSNASSRSTTAAVAGSVASAAIAPARAGLPFPPSRQGSTTSMRLSLTSAPGSVGPSSFIDPSFAYFQQQRQPFAAPQPGSSVYATPGGNGSTHGLSTPVGDGSASPNLVPASLRMDDVPPTSLPSASLHQSYFYKAELESVRRENEMLRNKIRELERMVRQRRESDVSRPRSGSAASASVRSVAVAPSPSLAHSVVAQNSNTTTTATTTTMPTAANIPPRFMASTPSVAGSVAIGVSEEEVRVGESAASTWPERGAKEMKDVKDDANDANDSGDKDAGDKDAGDKDAGDKDVGDASPLASPAP